MKYLQEVFEAIEFIEDHLTENLSVDDVARRSGLSSWHFQRIFRDCVRETIGSYLRRRRLAESLEALVRSQLRVIDVAIEYQFGSSEAYSRAFKDEFGVSPQKYRDTKPKVVPFRKPALSLDQVAYFSESIGQSPSIRELAPQKLIGLPVSFISPLAKRSDYMKVIPDHWRSFVARESEIENRLLNIKVGSIFGMGSPGHHVHEDMIEYLACVPVLEFGKIPSSMRAITVPGGTYAVFEAVGYHEQTQFIIDYVYSTWLPQADVKRGDGPEFTWLDHREQPLDPKTSKVQYFLPIE